MEKRSPVRRFPRLLEGEQAAALAKLLWQQPWFIVRGRKNKRNERAIEFKFRIPAPDGLRRSYPALWELFFGAGIKLWERALTMAYWETKSGDKTLHRYISNFLRVVYRNALGVWLKEVWTLSNNDERKEGQLRAFLNHAGIKRSQPDPWLALLVAERFEQLRPAIKNFRIRIRRQANMSDHALAQEFQACFPTVPPQKVFSRISATEGDSGPRVLFARIADATIAEAYLQCELDDRHYKLGKPSLKTYIRFGKQILQSLSELRHS